MAPEPARPSSATSSDWTQGPAKWGSAGFLGGASLVGLVWVLGAREPSPMLDRSHASVTLPAEAFTQEPQDEPAAKLPPTGEFTLPVGPALALLSSPNERAPEAAPEPTPATPPDPSPIAAPSPEPLPESSVLDLEPSPAPVDEGASPANPDASPAPDGDPGLAIRIRVNSASATELELLPGIGPVIAQRIADDRAQNGPFRDLRALQRVRGIGPKTADKLAAHVRFD